jgi:hypothetical protein
MEVTNQIDEKRRIDLQFEIKPIPSAFNPAITLEIFSASLPTCRSIKRASETTIYLFPEHKSLHPRSARRRAASSLPELARPDTEDKDAYWF